MRTSSNKKIGNDFEAELCGILFEHGFWTHNLAQNASGQPADIIAVRNGRAYLIDCKVCSGEKFDLRRVEENQDLAMTAWAKCGNKTGWFAIKIGGQIYMVPHWRIRDARLEQASMTKEEIHMVGYPLTMWVRVVS